MKASSFTSSFVSRARGEHMGVISCGQPQSLDCGVIRGQDGRRRRHNRDILVQ